MTTTSPAGNAHGLAGIVPHTQFLTGSDRARRGERVGKSTIGGDVFGVEVFGEEGLNALTGSERV